MMPLVFRFAERTAAFCLARRSARLSIFLNARGFAYVALEGALSPFDWGISDVYGRDKVEKSLRVIGRIMRALSPDVLVLRGLYDALFVGSRKLQNLVRVLEALATAANIPVYMISRKQVRQTFSFLGEQPTRSEIAVAIVKRVAVFEQYVPRPRKLWESEDRRIGLFDAVALGFAFYAIFETMLD